MLCDDDKDIVTLVQLIVSSMNHELVSITLITDIVAQTKSEKPALILMDLRIPEIGGFEATKLLKQDAATRTIPVILFSASIDVVKLCEECGADGYILKPFELGEFREKIKKITDN